MVSTCDQKLLKMPSKASLEVLQILATFLGYNVGLTPLRFIGLGNVIVWSNARIERWMKFWRWVLYFATFYSGLEIGWNLFHGNGNIVAILWNTIILLCRVGALGLLHLFQFQCESVCFLLNAIIEGAKTETSSSHFDKLLPMLLIVALEEPPLFIIICPVLAALLSGASHSMLLALIFWRENFQMYFRPFVLILEIMFMIPVGCIIPIGVSTAMLAISHILVFAKDLLKQVKTIGNFPTPVVNKPGRRYRQLQVFTLVCNEAFEICVWSAGYYITGGYLIIHIYALIEFHLELNAPLIFALFISMVLTSAFVFIVFDVGGMPVTYSMEILKLAKIQGKGDPWSKKFFRSCPPIALSIGGFYKIDRIRALIFFRFILQRTGVIVVNTKSLGVHSIDGI